MTLITSDASPPILWLYGPAGAGKSAIAQSIAERCEEENPKRLASSFFFSRRTSDRNSEKHLVATISYQLAVNLPETKPIIEEIVENDPSVFSRSVKVQLQNLVVEPLRRVSRENSPHRFIIIDGLDECNGDGNQCSILYAICEAVSGQRLPICFLIVSRPEPHIRNCFSKNNLFKLSQRIQLAQSRNDVSIFLRAEFERIRKDRGLSTTWPSNRDIQTLEEKASGHFIYPSTVIKFIDDPRHYPPNRLRIILGIGSPSNQSPFAELDSLYQEILKSTRDPKGTLRIIGLLLFMRNERTSSNMPLIQHLLGLERGNLESLLYDIHSILNVDVQGFSITIAHASLIDFIVDRSRSEDYFLDSKDVHADITQMCFRVLSPHIFHDGPGRCEFFSV